MYDVYSNQSQRYVGSMQHDDNDASTKTTIQINHEILA